ncbi:hypothetical protein JCM19235_5059 [Vibrio maritimus]|uniref:Uncharacterized protein n=1 Tax=Vibrio maritimus TaxID=990268 RepID=A0A090RM91_9VIBR|nr:hypothetical protein JCM19235_5059 [Vibrio maritimus]
MEDWSQLAQSVASNPTSILEQQMTWWNQQINLFNDCILSTSEQAQKETDPRFRMRVGHRTLFIATSKRAIS